MKFDFASFAVKDAAFSEQPMTLLDPGEAKAALSAILEIALLETADPTARERWQKFQLLNLLKHAQERSKFWRKRIDSEKYADGNLHTFPVLTRSELIEQVAGEGNLLKPGDNIPAKMHSTSGSSGRPVRFFYSAVNGQYNFLRSIAQYLMEGRDISLNRTRLAQGYSRKSNSLSVEHHDTWLGPLAALFKAGASKRIEYFVPDVAKVVGALTQDEIGYLVCMPSILETILADRDLSFLKEAKTQMWISLGEPLSAELSEVFSNLEIPIRSTYSSEEVGPIGFECTLCRGHYHIATSNILVEIGAASGSISGVQHGKVLITHLHSYATPFIRYDLGDLACLRETCPCGHQGPTLYNLQGRASSLLKHRDGRVSQFFIRAKELAALAQFTEYRMRQVTLDKIVVEIGGRTELASGEIDALRDLLRQRAGPAFEVEIKPCLEIAWGESRKRLGFSSELP